MIKDVKFSITTGLLIGLSVFLSSCGTQTDNLEVSKVQNNPDSAIEFVENTQNEVNTEDSKNEEVGTIKVLTDRSDFHLKKIAENFEKYTGIKVEISKIDKGLLNKIEGRNEGNVYISKNSSEILAAADKDLLGVINPEITKRVDSLHKGKEWVNMSYRDRVFYIKKGITDYPTTYEDLADSKYKERICIRPLTHNYNIELISYIYAKHGEEYTKEWLKGLIENMSRKPVGNDRNQVKGIAIDKICDIAVANTYYMGLMRDNPEQAEWAAAVDIFFPNQSVKEGEDKINGDISLFSAIAINKNDVDNKNVSRFVSYLLNDENQLLLSDSNYEYPIIGISQSEMVKSFGELQGLKVANIKRTKISQETITKDRNEVIKLIKEAEIKYIK